MPLERCQLDGKSGWRWGSAKCYTGDGAKEKALKQGRAIEISKHAKGSFQERLEILEEFLKIDKDI